MKRSRYGQFIFIALAATVAATVVQAEENIKVYGKARMSVNFTDAPGATSPGDTTSISSNASRLGFKGNEDLGNGLRALFQIETLVNMDDGTGGSGGVTNTGTLFGTFRNTYVGLASGFGTLALGATDNAYKLSTGKLDIYSDSMGDYNAIMGNVSGATTPFDEREPNGINYWSPKMNGFQLLAAYRLDEDDAVERDRYSLAGVYENGPYYATLAYELHENEANSTGGISTGTRIYDTEGWKAGLGYTFNHDNTKINFVYEDLAQEGAATLLDRDAWYLALTHKMGSNTLKAAYAQADDNDAGANTGADWFVLGLDHALSKRTTVYGLYANTNNDSAAQYGLGTGASSGAVRPTSGIDASTFSIGINHDF